MTKPKLLLLAMMVVLLLQGGCKKQEVPTTEEKPAAGPAPTPIDQATVATLTGKVVFAGKKPALKQIRMDAEPACAKLHSEATYSQEVEVNDNGTLKDVFIYVKEGLGNRTFATPTQAVVLDQKGCIYHPHVVGVQAGQNIDILNSDPTTHNIHPMPKQNREWNTSMPPQGEKLTRTFPREEVMIPVKCNVHPWMKSYIGVLKHPYYAVTGKDGSFEIKGLPPGEYTIEAWQDKYGPQDQKVSLGPKESKAIEFTFKGE